MKIYLFAGLGADERLFSQIKPIAGHEIIALPWIHPGDSKTMADYTEKYLAAHPFEQPCIVGGVSLGGMIAQEVAARIPVQKLILISTMASRGELPGLLKLGAALKLGHIAYKPMLEVLAALGDRFTIKSKEGRELFYAMIKESNADFLHFASKAILEWQPPGIGAALIRIHGDKDRVFPISRVGDCTVVEGGNHFMIVERGEEIGRLIEREIERV